MKEGSYQIFRWGWVADYPDPENFLFLLYGPMGRVHHNGPNSANFDHPRYNYLFERMKSLKNEESAEVEMVDEDTGETRTVTLSRREIIDRMVRLLQEEGPWIPVGHSESYAIVHDWYQGIKPPPIACCAMKYRQLDPATRGASVAAWNEPILWPAGLVVLLLAAVVVPGVRTYLRERQ